MPTFWIGLIALYVGFFRLGWFPGAERLDPGVEPPPHHTGLYTLDALIAGKWGLAGTAFHHIVLPALVLAAFNVSLLTRYTRSAILEVIGNDYVRAARAKGLPEHTVVTRYILRAALPSVVTVLGLVFANVLTGAVLVEKIFSWPGVGSTRTRPRSTSTSPRSPRQPVRRRRLHHDQLHRGRALRRHRPADQDHVSEPLVLPRRLRRRARSSSGPRGGSRSRSPARSSRSRG